MDFNDVPARLPERQHIVRRDAKGRCLPGSTLNPGGKSRTLAEITRIARDRYSVRSLHALFRIAEDPATPAAARVAAYREVLDRGLGKPPQALALALNPNEPAELAVRRAEVQETLAAYRGITITFEDRLEEHDGAEIEEEAEYDDGASTPAEDTGSSV